VSKRRRSNDRTLKFDQDCSGWNEEQARREVMEADSGTNTLKNLRREIKPAPRTKSIV
jgi:hypothetical protein